MKELIRVGNGCGFWGDNLDAPIYLAQRGRLDYLTLEYLAELTMSILALQKQRDPASGYASDFLDVLASKDKMTKEYVSGVKDLAEAKSLINALMLERDRFLTATNEALVHDVEHFEKRSVGRNARRFIPDEFALRLRIFLPPDFEFEVHESLKL